MVVRCQTDPRYLPVTTMPGEPVEQGRGLTCRGKLLISMCGLVILTGAVVLLVADRNDIGGFGGSSDFALNRAALSQSINAPARIRTGDQAIMSRQL
jgi:hypothetical protein